MFAINEKLKEQVIDELARQGAARVVEHLSLDQHRLAAAAIFNSSIDIRGFEKLCEIIKDSPDDHKEWSGYLDEHVGDV